MERYPIFTLHHIWKLTQNGSNTQIWVKAIKFLEDNIGANFCDPILGNGFLGMIPKAQVTKAKIDKLDFIKIKNFYALKVTTRE